MFLSLFLADLIHVTVYAIPLPRHRLRKFFFLFEHRYGLIMSVVQGGVTPQTAAASETVFTTLSVTPVLGRIRLATGVLDGGSEWGQLIRWHAVDDVWLRSDEKGCRDPGSRPVLWRR